LEADGSPKIQFGPKLETACTTPVSEGMHVVTTSQKVKDARHEVLEFLLTSHPLDCPICDKGGECPLQNLTMAHGPAVSRFIYDEKNHLAKQLPLGELIYLDRERCIQCGRCVRFQNEIADDPAIAFYQRGRSMEIITDSVPGFDSVFSGNTTDICPVGALTTADFRFGARPWEMNSAASICTLCPVGCNITFNVRREAVSGGKSVIKRVMPRQNEAVNEIWICDKGRFGYHFTESPERLAQPLLRKDGKLVPVDWDEALTWVAEKVKELSGNMVTLVSGKLANEDLFNLQQFTLAHQGEPLLFSHMAGGDLVAQVGLGKDTNLGTLGKGTTVLVVASDLHEEAPVWWLRLKQAAARGVTLIVANPRPTRLDKFAAHVLRYEYGEEADLVSGFVPGHKSAYPEVAEAFTQAENAIIFYGSEGLGLEGSRALSAACAELLVRTNHAGHVNNGLVAVWPDGNTQGAWDMGFRPAADLDEKLAKAGLVLIAGADPVAQDPHLAESLKKAGFVAVQEMFLTKTAQLADVVFPVQAFTEREGTLTSGERRVQRFYPAVPPLEGTRPDYAITAELARRTGLQLETSPALLLQKIAGQVPAYAGLTYQELAKATEQYPIVGRSDLYYGGTTYDNHQGLGVQLAPASQNGEAVKPSKPESVKLPRPRAGELLVVPISRLYSRDTATMSAALLAKRMASPALVLNPKLADRQRVKAGQSVHLALDGGTFDVQIVLDEAAPEKVALLPRNVGVPLTGPRVGTLERK
ncbi:MAG TPA: molybdopterin-dependent oxidoreductase, partial [Longilinea sp.]|nr:molybdopterin-dependent oxidoreductase [Longilinea sp.]